VAARASGLMAQGHRKVPMDQRLYALHLVSLGVPKSSVARRYGVSSGGVETWLRIASRSKYSWCRICDSWFAQNSAGCRKYCDSVCMRLAVRERTAEHRAGKVDLLCRWCLVAPKAYRRQHCSDDCYRQWTNHRLAHGTDLWCLLPLCSECGLVKGINHMPGECRGCLATSSRRREARRSPSSTSCQLCGVCFFAFGRGWSKPKFCEECRSAKRLERQRLSEEAGERRRLEKEALPRPLCKLCLSIIPVPKRSYCSKKCQRIMENHYRHHGPDLWRVLPLCQRCGLVKGINHKPGYCRQCSVIAKKEAKLRQRMNGNDPNRTEFYRSGDKITRQGVLDRTGYRCHLCKKRVRLNGNPNHPLYFQVDHIIPRSKGGTHTWNNVATCCRSCNGNKGNKAVGDQLRLLTVGGV